MNWWKNISFSEYKHGEIQLATWEWDDSNDHYFNFTFNWSRKCDHAGPNLTIEIYRFYFCVQIYDSRHWNNEHNRYCVYGKDGKEIE